MPQIFKFTFLALFISFLSISNLFAQASATATATANLITPISITKNVDMNFGNIAVSPTDPGTVVLPPVGVRTKTGGVTLPAIVGTISAASFTVTGESGYNYSITLPVGSVTLTSGANTMTLNNFTSDPSSTGTLTSGTSTLNVGGTLNVAAAQHSGSYTSTGFTVTVNYN